MRKYNIEWQRLGEDKIHTCKNLTVIQLVARLINAVKNSKVIIHKIVKTEN